MDDDICFQEIAGTGARNVLYTFLSPIHSLNDSQRGYNKLLDSILELLNFGF
jgi:hypothetical protein